MRSCALLLLLLCGTRRKSRRRRRRRIVEHVAPVVQGQLRLDALNVGQSCAQEHLQLHALGLGNACLLGKFSARESQLVLEVTHRWLQCGKLHVAAVEEA